MFYDEVCPDCGGDPEFCDCEIIDEEDHGNYWG